MAETSPILTDAQRQKYAEALEADANARKKLQDENESDIAAAVQALVGLAAFNTVTAKLDEISQKPGFMTSRFAAHVHAISTGASHLKETAA